MEADRISALPDHLLHHILSSIDTQVVIKTTYLLSKRWTKLWTSIPTLIFDFPSFSCHHLNREICFRRFIKRVLSYRRMHITPLSKVKKLSLYLLSQPIGWRDESEELLDTERFANEDIMVFKLLFYFAALNDVEELCIDGGCVDLSDWCCSFSTCRSLKLSGYFDTIWVPHAHSFEFLKSLEIENLYSSFYFDLEGDMFLPTFPLLERLILRGSCFELVRISAPKLEYLEMGSSCFGDDGLGLEIWLSTPKLASVKLHEVVPILISEDDFLSIQKVEFSLGFDVSLAADFMKEQVVKRLRGVFNLLQKASSLRLTSMAVEVFSEFIVPYPMKDEAFMFPKLRHLRLEGDHFCDTIKPNHMLSCLLNSPSLETWHADEHYWKGF